MRTIERIDRGVLGILIKIVNEDGTVIRFDLDGASAEQLELVAEVDAEFAARDTTSGLY